MREIHTIDPGRYEEGSRPGLVRQVGMQTAQEVFDELKSHLEEVGLMPDEYFLSGSHWWNGKNPELPEYSQAVCNTNWGSNEGIYIDIDLQYLDDNHDVKTFHLATGKTLGSSGDDFLRMSRIAAECSMMLNGWGNIVKVNEQEKENEKAVNILENLVNSKHLSDRLAVAQQGYGLDRLVFDDAFQVRAACAAQGYGQHILVKDPEPMVRKTLAENGFCLDVLVHDPVVGVREEVAKQGYALDTLRSDPHELVRYFVATHGRPQDLAVLVNDSSWYVRSQVVEQGYGLDKLVSDNNPTVRVLVNEFLEEQGISLVNWISQNPDRCAFFPEKKRPGLDSVIKQADERREAQSAAMDKQKFNDERDV